MPISRYISLLDLCVIIVVAIVLVMPARAMMARKVTRLSVEADQALALAEARVIAHPDDGFAITDLAHQLTEAGHRDWAVEAAARATVKATTSPTYWRAVLATSVAYVDRLEVVPALDWGQRALVACHAAGEVSCPGWQQIRMELYNQHLDAGVKSGIDPRHNPLGFRAAGENGLRTIHLDNLPSEPRAPAPAPAH